MTGLSIWLTAAALYGIFRYWYDNWRGPLTASEIDDYLGRLSQLPSAAVNDMAQIRTFLEADDGREFIMLNIVRVAAERIPHPTTGELRPAREIMEGYFKQFVPALVRRAGHPAIVARRVGPYIDAWNVEPDPGWTLMGYMRYRSRRDMLELAVDPRFSAAHPFKVAATPVTFSFPTRPQFMLFLSPRVWVGLVLALLAALLHLAVLACATST